MEAAWEVKGTISIWNWVKLNLRMKKVGGSKQAGEGKRERAENKSLGLPADSRVI